MVSRTDGWDGWIELSGLNHQSVNLSGWAANLTAQVGNNDTRGLQMDPLTGKVDGMAWGGPVVGWLQFNATVKISDFTATCSATDRGNNSVLFTAEPKGGTVGKYEYKWGNGAWSSVTPTKVVTYIPGTSPVTYQLLVREQGGSVELNPTCSYTPPQEISASCGVSATNVYVGDNVTFSVLADPTPAGTYTYSWITDSGVPVNTNSVKSYTRTYSTAGQYNASVNISNNTGSTKNFACPSVGSGPITVTERGINLFIGKDGNDAALGFGSALVNRERHTVKKGQKFGLAWENTLSTSGSDPNRYVCDKLIPSSTSVTNWNAKWGASSITEGGSIEDMNTDETGTFEFKISCQARQTGDVKSAKAILKVMDSTGSEI
jgi:hypothetical protein